MNYELALKLKEAGFPQGLVNTTDEHGWTYFQPNLSELIEACGDRFHCLIHTIYGGVDGDKSFWSAGINDIVKDWSNGITPEEAVAHLYLALNKK